MFVTSFQCATLRSIKRDIGHLCHDEPKTKPNEAPILEEPMVASPTSAVPNNPADSPFNFPVTGANGASTWPLVFPPEASSTEFSVLRCNYKQGMVRI